MTKLVSPITIRNVIFGNRLVLPPMVRLASHFPPYLVETGGQITDAVIEHYASFARAGLGLIIVEATAVDPGGRAWPSGLNLFCDDHIPGLTRLAHAIKAAGARAGIQLVHAGPGGSTAVIGGPTVGPSPIAPKPEKPIPRELTIPEILAIQDRFADAANRAVLAGFEYIELHSAHGTLLDSFLMTSRNRRSDAYGGSSTNRQRMVLETSQKVRDRLASRALLSVRISIFNKQDEGFGPEDLRLLVAGLEQSGLDVLHLSTDSVLSPAFGSTKTMAQWTKALTKLPLIVAGKLQNTEDANRVIAERHADFAAIGRALLANPKCVQCV